MVPASVFIMDVSNSSSAENGETLSRYLSELESTVKSWSGRGQVNHRAGDELIVLAEGYSSAFIIAFYISRVWKYRLNAPYFGLSFGSIEKSIDAIDIEKWIHPLVKQARDANDYLKKQKDRESFHFQSNDIEPELQVMMNGMLSLQHVLSEQQTEIQRLVCSLYLIYGKQNAVADLLGRSAPTVYSHFKKGHSEQILQSFQEIVRVLDSVEAKSFPDLKHLQENGIQTLVKKDIKVQVREVFSL
ncbi:hypothetical protein J7E38_03205 [Bacillus sp. ISL-35]|uniref:hypothetical protein n=1 Tax=Bacillus sp. ISL-35 TaxID=2819122 RepID=UPI001BE86B33|nr:hypothetical protein [Bacillus sp. ISL-35]MBT2677991.1 hypothetical protein [Bacillus sp. ISL-35]MBT2705426.1 hypothetical protein [Chryseobacterium sp. ISL-80]